MRQPGRAPPRLLAALLVLASCAGVREAASPGGRPEAERRAFEVPGWGALDLAIPPGWVAEAVPGEPPAPVTVRMRGPGSGFLALVTPFWNPGEPEDGDARADTAQLFAEIARRKALPGAVEREIPLEELVGDGVHGFWFAATDRELVGKQKGQDEWRHILQGAAAVGPLVVAFTLLDDAPGPQRAAFLEVIRGARYAGEAEEEEEEEEPGEGEDEGGEMEPDPGVRTVPLRVASPGRSWAILVDLPDFGMFRPHVEADGSVIVLGQAPGTLIVASVILRRAGEARDAAGCREADLARIRGGEHGIRRLRLEAAGGAARATYAIEDRGAQEHAHAWLHRDGFCANVHLSKLDPEEGDAERMSRILGSVRFGEDL